MPVHSTWLSVVTVPFLGKRSATGVGARQNMYVTLQKRHYLTSLEGDVHVLDLGPGSKAMRARVEWEGCPNFERSSKYIRSAYADRAALKTRYGRVFFTLRALAGSNPSSCALLKCARKEKAPLLGLIPSNGGGGGIRTLVTLYRPNGFRDRRIQPLCHPSAWGKNKAGSKACFGINWRRVRDLNPGDAFDAYTISNRAPSATRTTLR